MAAGSPRSRPRQNPDVTTATRGSRSAAASSAEKVRPIAALTPSTSKKFAVTFITEAGLTASPEPMFMLVVRKPAAPAKIPLLCRSR
jgi:hypothetical protein